MIIGRKIFLIIILIVISFFFFFTEISAQNSAPMSPVKLAVVYKTPESETTGVALSATEVAQKFQLVIYARNDGKASLPSQQAAGFSGLALQYIIINPGIMGPGTISESVPSANSPYCMPDEKIFKPYSNNITLTSGAFCELNDSIIGKLKNDTSKKFDHDLNPVTPPIWADESWFVHRADNGKRFASYNGPAKAFYANHGNPDWQTYFKARMMEQMKGSLRYPAFGMNGVYLDNLDLSLGRFTRMGSLPKEFANSASFIQAEVAFVSTVYSVLHSAGNNFHLLANMTFENDTGSDWDLFIPILDGGFKEDFVLDWGRGAYTTDIMLNQLTQAQKWLDAGKFYLAVSPGNLWPECPARNASCVGNHPLFDRQARFSLASFLLVTEGQNGFFKFYNYFGDLASSREEFYMEFYDYPQYYYRLGLPLGPRYQISSSPLSYRRDFQCGRVTADLTNITGSIILNQNCIPISTNPTGTPTPSNPSPPPGCLKKPLGDANCDGRISVSDFEIWRREFTSSASTKSSDFNNSGNVSVADFDIWRTTFTNQVP